MTERGAPAADTDTGLRFWPWFFTTGVRGVVDRWLALHVVAGVVLALAIPGTLTSVAQTAFLPFASILIGLTFAWGGNATAVLQSRELHVIGNQPGNPLAFRDWAFSFQLAILAIIAVVVVWALAAAGVSDRLPQLLPSSWRAPGRFAGRVSAFALSSIAIREAWNVVLGAQAMLVAQDQLRREQGDDSK